MADRQANSSHAAIQRTLDDGLVLGLVIEYLTRRAPGGVGIRTSDLVQRGCIRQMGLFAAQHVRQARHVLSDRAFANERPWPELVRKKLFVDAMPGALKPFVGDLPITILGDFHQMCLSNPLHGARQENQRRATGAHYTPPCLVDYMVSRAFATVRRDGIDPYRMRILDPSCGCGVFLIAVMRH
jgi:type I restriction-modification system DNA methylase subunit